MFRTITIEHMNLAEQMRAKAFEVTNRDKVELLFKELVLPRIELCVSNKQTEASFSNFTSNREDARVKEVFPKVSSLQDLVGGEMMPYLIELGFRVVTCSPSYYTYIRW